MELIPPRPLLDERPPTPKPLAFSLAQIGLASLVSTGLGGAALMAINARRVGASGTLRHLALGLAMTVNTIIAGFSVDSLVGLVGTLLFGVAFMVAYAAFSQPEEIAALIQRKQVHSTGYALIVGLLCTKLVLFVSCLLVVVLHPK